MVKGASSGQTVYLVIHTEYSPLSCVCAVRSDADEAEHWIEDQQYSEQHYYTVVAHQVDDAGA
jgi:hypothetical protein